MCIGIHSQPTNPAPVVLTSSANHWRTAAVFLNWSVAFWAVTEALSDIKVLVELSSILLTAKTSMFDWPTKKADLHFALTTRKAFLLSFLSLYDAFAVGLRTEYFLLIHSYFKFESSNFELCVNFVRESLEDLIFGKFVLTLGATKLHNAAFLFYQIV